MKKITLFALFVAQIALAQAPAGYYDSTVGLTGYALKTQLKKIIDDNTDGLTPEYLHTDQGYSSLWTLFANNNAFHDIYDENDNTLYDMYSEVPGGTDPYNFTLVTNQCGSYSGEGDCYNREHLIPQSYFDHFAVAPMKNDPFHAVPSDGYVNGQRNNLPFGEVSSATYTSQNGSQKGSNITDAYSSYNGTVFEPLDEFKGDIARCFFYFATRYEDLMDDFYSGANASTCEAKNMFDGSTDKVFSDAFIFRLIKWHKEDPVSAKEINQNNVIFSYQNNRNPFIDNPDFVCEIYPTQCAAVDALEAESFALNSVSLFPNPSATGEFTVQSQTPLTLVTVYTINGQVIQQLKPQSETFKINNLSKGFYLIKLDTDAASTIQKVIVN
ncbi:endonuclease [Flavobacterium sp. NRK F10]|uniref:endonuclease n=1 Tax=Flavobacterium sp. NRK F10 TaxID=2954931 RepID=UPI00209092BA|nr:endonuclease [Flavobacterium sp. NRK F10]MCO6176089.1 endonuclease [Flavobacterium sp. NRK F10]